MVNDWLRLWYTKTYGRPATARRKRDFPVRGERLEGRSLLSLVLTGNFVVGDPPKAIAQGDFDGDGKPDLVTANVDTGGTQGSVRLLFGNGDGTFTGAQNFATSAPPTSVAVGDVNLDGKPDLVVSQSGSTVLSVRLGTGDPTRANPFQAPQNVTVGLSQTGVAIGDVDVDGKPDLVTSNISPTNPDTVSVLKGVGDGTFGAPQNFSIGAGKSPYSVTLADLNGDGRLDAVTANANANGINTVSVLLNNGSGAFGASTDYNALGRPVAVAASDLDGDGDLDLAVANSANTITSLSILLNNGSGVFTDGTPLNVGGAQSGVSAADLNGDGKVDLAVANRDNANAPVGVFLGNGDGTFTPLQGFVAGTSPAAILAADLTGDGRPDIASAASNGGSPAVSVLIQKLAAPVPGTGTAAFAAARNFAVGGGPVAIAVADFDRDGKVDLATANSTGNSVSLLKGNGDGNFSTAAFATLTVGTNPRSLAAADFNRDGKADLAVAHASGQVNIYLGNGNGTFSTSLPAFIGGTAPTSIAAADFNLDGKPDLAVADGGSNVVNVFFGDGLGGIASGPTALATGTGPQAVIAADVNRDGKLDVVTANSSGSVTAWLNSSASPGSFSQAAGSPVTVGQGASSVVAGDLNGDGKADLAVANATDGTVSVLVGNADGTFQAARNFSAAPSAQAVAIADFNGDGRADLATANHNDPSGTVSVLLGNGDGNLQAPLNFVVGSKPAALAAVDFNRDGKPDLAVANEGSNTVSVLLNIPRIALQAPQNFATGPNPLGVVIADLDRDGKPDLVVGSNDNTGKLSTLLGNGDGTFKPAATLTAGSDPRWVAVADVNLDGKPDIVTANFRGDSVSIFPGNSDGTFGVPQNVSVGAFPRMLAVGDLDGDGKPDIAVTNSDPTQPAGSVSILKGGAGGVFTLSQTIGVGKRPYAVAIADLDGDGKPDLAVSNYGSTTVSVLRNTGNVGGIPSFAAPANFTVGNNPYAMVVADLNGDGKPDIATANYRGGSVVGPTYRRGTTGVLLNSSTSGTVAFQAVQETPVGLRPTSIQALDVNGDGKRDLAVANFQGGNVVILPGNGDGTFQAAQAFATATSTGATTLGDVNLDGMPDVVSTLYANSLVSVQLQDTLGLPRGTGQFDLAPGTINVGTNPSAIAYSDVTNDGKADVVVTNQNGSGTVTIVPGNGDGTFQAAQSPATPTGSGPDAVAVADLNGDGRADIVTADYTAKTVTILLSNGNGTFSTATSGVATGPNFTGPTSVKVADFNGDGKPDLVVGNSTYYSTPVVSVLLNNGDGTFPAAATSLPLALSGGTAAPRSVAVGDFNRDGAADLAVGLVGASPGFTLDIRLGNGAGGFTAADKFFDAGPNPRAVEAADLNRDGKLDLIATNSTGTVSVLLGNGDGTFQTAMTGGPVGASAQSVAVADLDGDGKLDLVVANAGIGSNTVSVLLGNANGTFQAAQNFTTSGTNVIAVAVADVDGDGLPDILAVNKGSSTVSLLKGRRRS